MSDRLEFLVQLNGISPLVMHDNRSVDQLSVEAQELSRYTKKRTKTEADHMAIRQIEFRNGMYYRADWGPYIPARALHKTIIVGGRKQKRGKDFESGLYIPDDARLMDYGWSEQRVPTVEDLYNFEDRRFVWSTVCGNQKASIIRTRPRFDEWATKFIVSIENGLLDRETLTKALNDAGICAGLLDGRSIGMGRFTARVFSTEELECEPEQALAMA